MAGRLVTRPLLIAAALLLAVAGLASVLTACVITNNDATDYGPTP